MRGAQPATSAGARLFCRKPDFRRSYRLMGRYRDQKDAKRNFLCANLKRSFCGWPTFQPEHGLAVMHNSNWFGAFAVAIFMRRHPWNCGYSRQSPGRAIL